MADLVLGPLLRYVGEREATVWVETDEPCEVEVLGARERTFCVEGHHYALVHVEGLEPVSVTEYEVALDGERRWPEPGSGVPPSVIRTLSPEGPVRLVFGSCRVSLPHEPPYTLRKDDDERGRERDALYALALRMRDQPHDEWPHLLMLLGDQVYADEVSPDTRRFIESRRDTSEPPGEEVADFEEYAHLYREAWRDPVLRWILSTVSSAMIFDDHDVHDDWNTSLAWVEEMRSKPWWDERIASAFMSYWLYQHLGNLSPRALREDGLLERVRQAEDGGAILREFGLRADRTTDGSQWSYCRDLAHSKLVVVDSRAGRVLAQDGSRAMVDEEEWAFVEREATGDCEHLLVASSLPFLLAPGLHHVEAWNEAVCAGAWGGAMAKLGERLRQGVDLEHWAAFDESFDRVADLLRAIGAGEHGSPPASIVLLSGDVHHAYLADVAFRRNAGVESAVYQAVCSPIRNPLDSHQQAVVRLAASKPAEVLGHALARAAGVADPEIRWRFTGEPTFDNQIATIDLEGRSATLRLEKTLPEDEEPVLHEVFETKLA